VIEVLRLSAKWQQQAHDKQGEGFHLDMDG
jgi:hypothetical protein